MKARKKLFFYALLILVLIFSAGVIYLNNALLPTKIKSLIIRTLEEQTQKKVSLESLRFHILKGLVLRGLVIYDEKETVARLQEASCTFFILPLLKRRVVLPNLKLRSLEVTLERKPDNTFNLQYLFSKLGPGAAHSQKSAFGIFVYKVTLTQASVHFRDATFTPVFAKDIQNLDLVARLSLPGSIKFNLSAEIPAAAHGPMLLEGQGEFKLAERVLAAKISIQDFSPQEFTGYIKGAGIDIKEGLIDGLIDFEFKEGTLYADVELKNKNLLLARDNMSLSLCADMRFGLLYNFEERQAAFSGKAKVFDSKISGLELFGSINNISAELAFSDTEISSDNLKGEIWNIPVEAKVVLNDFRAPQIHVDLFSKVNLEQVPSVLKDKFKFVFLKEIKGQGDLALSARARLVPLQGLEVSGSLDILNASLKLDKIDAPVEDLKGKITFTQDQVQWQELNFKYQEIPYKLTGVCDGFLNPKIQLALTSRDLSLESELAMENRIVALEKCLGRYRHSNFSFSGSINVKDLAHLLTDIKGELDVDLQDMKEPLVKWKQFQQAKPQGFVQVDVAVKGDANDMKSCAIKAKLSSDAFSLYGLRAQQFELVYNQENGLGQMPLARLSFYDGTLEANGTINLKPNNFPYGLAVNVQGVNLEKLKLDTAAKDKDVAGTVYAQAKLNGVFKDLPGVTGEGKMSIAEGKLWQLNLFKGLGSLLFSRDFANIIFHQGTCDFSVKEKSVSTDNLLLKSDITDLTGSVRLGFDSSIEASLNVRVLDNKAPLTGTFKDITTAIIGEGGRFGVIKVSGTLKEPKYKFHTAVIDILKGLKNSLLGG